MRGCRKRGRPCTFPRPACPKLRGCRKRVPAACPKMRGCRKILSGNAGLSKNPKRHAFDIPAFSDAGRRFPCNAGPVFDKPAFLPAHVGFAGRACVRPRQSANPHLGLPRGVCWPRVRASSAISKPAFRPPVWGLLTANVTTAISKPAFRPPVWGLLTVLVPVAISKPASRPASQRPCCAFAPCWPHGSATSRSTSRFGLLKIS
jgi:hypothetical protein